MIEARLIPTLEGVEAEVIVDGVEIQVFGFGYSGNKLVDINVRGSESTRAVAAHTFNELASIFEQVSFELRPDWSTEDLRLTIRLHPDALGRGEMSMRLGLEFHYVSWSKPWSVRDYCDKIEMLISERGESLLEVTTSPLTLPGPIEFVFPVRNVEAVVQEEVDYWLEQVRAVTEEANASLMSETDKDALVSLFHFPSQIQTACEQYLLYFVQFLRDLGIEAKADLRHEAHNVLFRVTPTEGPKALNAIREALDAYLQLPVSPDFSAEASKIDDVAVRQLESNVYHLQSQLALAEATLQVKDAAIEALRISNFRYRQLLMGTHRATQIDLSISIEETEDSESVIEGIVDVTSYEGKGFKVNLPELLRRLKRRLGLDR